MTTFHSTRSTTDSLTSKQAIRKGIADDGGLFVTDSLGETHVDVASLAGKSYQQIAFDVLSVLLPDFSETELKACIDEAYGAQWSDEKITPVKPLGDDYVMELFNGPTSAFKDVALQILPRFMARTTPAGGDGNEKIMIVTATSGDTGKAALAGFADAEGTGITVFYPEGKVSQVQELQMSTQAGSNVNVCAVKGNFDDAQSAVKRIFGDRELADRLASDSHVVLSSANSINVGRLVPQVVYYFSAYAQLLEQQVINVGDEVEFVVPTGNFGDILAGYYAKLLGLPVKHLVVASDKNNVLFDFLTSGTYNRQRPFYQTISPSMDILTGCRNGIRKCLTYRCLFCFGKFSRSQTLVCPCLPVHDDRHRHIPAVLVNHIEHILCFLPCLCLIQSLGKEIQSDIDIIGNCSLNMTVCTIISVNTSIFRISGCHTHESKINSGSVNTFPVQSGLCPLCFVFGILFLQCCIRLPV